MLDGLGEGEMNGGADFRKGIHRPIGLPSERTSAVGVSITPGASFAHPNPGPIRTRISRSGTLLPELNAKTGELKTSVSGIRPLGGN